MTNTAICVENLSKRYRIGQKEALPETFIGAMSAWLKSPLTNFKQLRQVSHFSENGHDPKDVIWALKDVCFEVKHGEAVGIIGRNGAGKSTLLKILSRITEPTAGRAAINGRVSSLLEVGTGFHPELTGRENVYLNGIILGMSKKEVDRKFDEIVDFSDIEKFIDTPVKRYSSGMKVRLAFAVAAHLEPEILLVDEVLAVGDAAFQKKCLGKMGTVTKEGRTVLFISHQLDMVRSLCDRGIWLYQGQVKVDGDSDKVIEDYLDSLDSQVQASFFQVEEDSNLNIQIVGGRVVSTNGKFQNRFDVFDQIAFDFEYVIRKPTRGVVVYFELKRNETMLLQSFDTDTDPQKLALRQPGHYRCHLTLPCPLLKSGRYAVTVGISIPQTAVLQRLEDVFRFEVELNSKPSTFLSYADRRSGVIAVPLIWQTIDNQHLFPQSDTSNNFTVRHS